MQNGCQGLHLLFHPFHPVEHDFFPCLTDYLPQRHGIVKPHITPLCTTSSCLHCFSLTPPLFLLSAEAFCSNPHRRRQNVDARFRFSSFYDQDPCSINFTTTRRSPSNASSPDVPAHTDKSEYAGCSPGANPPTLKSDMKAPSESQFSAFFETVWGSDCCGMGKRGILRVTPRFRGKRGCRGSVRSCVLRHGSGESVAVVVL
ncbi:uncharacterized protein LOC127898930 [Citrus sinensis]|uniref:uncharacterized protein LOC127898930 n=1 Tax=Citrus sinensis TaxID=2711 RepID=UPI0022795F8E|nr:uncharacterized protein LOC127898930 [Citrus sinensis]